MTDIGNHLVQLDRRRHEVRRPITEFAAVRIKRQQPHAVSERRRDHPSVDAERDLFYVAAADVRLRDVVRQATPVSKQRLRTVHRGRHHVGASGAVFAHDRRPFRDVDGVMPRKDGRPYCVRGGLGRRERGQVIEGGRRLVKGCVWVDDIAVDDEADAAESTDAVRCGDYLLTALCLSQRRLLRLLVRLSFVTKETAEATPTSTTPATRSSTACRSPAGRSSPSSGQPHRLSVSRFVIFSLYVMYAGPLKDIPQKTKSFNSKWAVVL